MVGMRVAVVAAAVAAATLGGAAPAAAMPSKADLFAAADANGDGAVTMQELRAFLDRWPRMIPSMMVGRVLKAFAQADVNGDGKVTRAEMDAFLAHH